MVIEVNQVCEYVYIVTYSEDIWVSPADAGLVRDLHIPPSSSILLNINIARCSDNVEFDWIHVMGRVR